MSENIRVQMQTTHVQVKEFGPLIWWQFHTGTGKSRAKLKPVKLDFADRIWSSFAQVVSFII